MIDVGADLQRAYDDGYKQGVKDTLADIRRTLDKTLKENFAHLIKTEPTISKMEQVEDEPQTDVYEYKNGEWVKPDCPWK